MPKCKVIILALLLLFPIVYAATEVQYSTDNATWTNVTSVAEGDNEAYQINLQQDTTYYFRARNDSSTWGYTEQRTKEGLDNMWLLAILLIPLGLCFFFVYLAHTLNDIHNPLKWFFRLLALIMVFLIYQGAHIIIQMNPDYVAMTNMFNNKVYGYVFWTIIAYFLIYIIYKLFMSFKHRKQWNWNNRFME